MVEVIQNSTQHYTEQDLRAVATYLKSLPAQQKAGAYQLQASAPQSSAPPMIVSTQHKDVSLMTGRIGHPGAGLYMSFCVKRSEEHTSELQSLMRISYAV